MEHDDAEKTTRKEALKELRSERKDVISAVSTKVKEQKQAIKAIKKALQDGGRTVPEIAVVTDLPSSEVFWYLMALKKYGEVLEGAKVGSYFRYLLAVEEAQKTEIKAEI